MAKVRSHKFGRRKLATSTAWNHYNRLTRLAFSTVAAIRAQVLPTLTAIANDAQVQDKVRKMNIAIKTIMPYFGRTDTANDTIVLNAPTEMFIPWNVWMGRLKDPFDASRS